MESLSLIGQFPLTTLTILGVLTIGVLIGLSAFFSSSEIALFSLPPHRVDALVADNVPGAKRLKALKTNPHRLLVTILVGNNIVNIATSSIATGLLAFYLPAGQAVIVATFGVTSLVLLFGESAPKSYAVEHTESWALTVARPLKTAEYLLLPLVVVFDFLTRQLNRITGGRAALEEQYITREEIEAMVHAGEREGAIEEAEHELFQRLFRFSSLIAKDAMTPRLDIDAVSSEATSIEALTICIESGHDRLPVYQDSLDNVIGIVTLQDLVASSRTEDRERKHVEGVRGLVQPAMHVPEGKALDELLLEMRESRTELSLVIDEFGTTEGLLTLEDITEELVGEILERTEIHPMERLDDRRTLIRGDVNIELVNEMLATDIPEGAEYQTISGFVLDRIGQMPREGDEVRYRSVTIRVEQVEGTQIQRLLVTEEN
jgi:putative hemolysin